MKDFLRTSAIAFLIVGVWAHDWRTILASLSVWFMWPLINMDLMAEGECLGCGKGRIVPGCPIHDPMERRTPPAVNGDAVEPTKEKGSSFVAY